MEGLALISHSWEKNHFAKQCGYLDQYHFFGIDVLRLCSYPYTFAHSIKSDHDLDRGQINLSRALREVHILKGFCLLQFGFLKEFCHLKFEYTSQNEGLWG